MNALEFNDADVALSVLRQEIAAHPAPRYQHRLYAMICLAMGMSCQDVGNAFGEDRGTVQRWMKRYLDDGLDGLRDRKPTGRPSTLSDKDRERLKKDLNSSPSKFGFGNRHRPGRWNPDRLVIHLAKHYGVGLSSRQCRRILNRHEAEKRQDNSDED